VFCSDLTWTLFCALQQRFLKEAQNSVKKNAYFMRKAMVSVGDQQNEAGDRPVRRAQNPLLYCCRMRTTCVRR
jgi:hypothetical protein